MISRLMLNLQNPLLFETHSGAWDRTSGTGTYVGPFVTTILSGASGAFTSSGARTGFTGMGITTMDADTDTERSRGMIPTDESDEWWEEEGHRPRAALWYDRAWVSGSRSATTTRTGNGGGARNRADEAVEELGKWILRLCVPFCLGKVELQGTSAKRHVDLPLFYFFFPFFLLLTLVLMPES